MFEFHGGGATAPSPPPPHQYASELHNVSIAFIETTDMLELV